MKITVIGAGNAGTTIAADLSVKGHCVTLLKTSRRLHNENFDAICRTGTVQVEDLDGAYTAKLHRVTTDMEQAMDGAELVIVYVQTNYHRDVIAKLAPYIRDGQTFLLEPGYLSTCYFLQNTTRDITVIEAESSPIDCRITAPGQTKVLFKNVLNPFGVYPKRRTAQAAAILDQLGWPYTLTENVVEAALHNPNLIVHTVGALFSIPRIEYSHGDYWMYREVFTPHIWNVVESLDREKMDVLEKLGCRRLPYVEACKLRNCADQDQDALSVFQDYAQNGSPSGPTVPDSRYITEDVPEGLVMLESLGQVLGVPTPTCTGLISCASAALNTDFRRHGRSCQTLDIRLIRQILDDAVCLPSGTNV